MITNKQEKTIKAIALYLIMSVVIISTAGALFNDPLLETARYEKEIWGGK